MAFSKTNDTFQLPSALPPEVGSTIARVEKQTSKRERGELGSKESKGEPTLPDSAFHEQVEVRFTSNQSQEGTNPLIVNPLITKLTFSLTR